MKMNEFDLDNVIDKLCSLVNNFHLLKNNNVYVSKPYLDEMKICLSQLFDNCECREVLYTNNIDNLFFGIRVVPIIDNHIAKIIYTEEEVLLTKFKIEFDSRLFEMGLSVENIVAYILYEVSSIINSSTIIKKCRDIINLLIVQDDYLPIRKCLIHSRLIGFGLIDTMYKLTGLIFREPEELIINKLIQTAKLEEVLVNTHTIIIESLYGISNSIRTPKVSILEWVFQIYKDLENNKINIINTLKEAIDLTGSKLEKKEINNIINFISSSKIIFEDSTNITLNKFFEINNMSSLNEISFFKQLRQSGLRSIEDSMYEYALRIKNCETEEDAMYILHGINTRLNTLEDYMYNTPELSENERSRWQKIAFNYRAMRDELIKKKIANKKTYGIFIDYDKLDLLDKPVDNNY